MEEKTLGFHQREAQGEMLNTAISGFICNREIPPHSNFEQSKKYIHGEVSCGGD